MSEYTNHKLLRDSHYSFFLKKRWQYPLSPSPHPVPSPKLNSKPALNKFQAGIAHRGADLCLFQTRGQYEVLLGKELPNVEVKAQGFQLPVWDHVEITCFR